MGTWRRITYQISSLFLFFSHSLQQFTNMIFSTIRNFWQNIILPPIISLSRWVDIFIIQKIVAAGRIVKEWILNIFVEIIWRRIIWGTLTLVSNFIWSILNYLEEILDSCWETIKYEIEIFSDFILQIVDSAIQSITSSIQYIFSKIMNILNFMTRVASYCWLSTLSIVFFSMNFIMINIQRFTLWIGRMMYSIFSFIISCIQSTYWWIFSTLRSIVSILFHIYEIFFAFLFVCYIIFLINFYTLQ